MAESDAANFFTDSLYNKLKYIAQIILPALGTLVFSIGGTLDWDYTLQTVGIITSVDVFLGVVLQLSSTAYYRNEANFDGDVNVTHDPTTGENKVVFAFDHPPEEIVDVPGKHSMEFKINRLDEEGQ